MKKEKRKLVELKFKDGKSIEVNTLGELIDAVHDNTMLCIASYSSCLFVGPRKWFVRDVEVIQKHYGREQGYSSGASFVPLRDRKIISHRIRKLPGEPRMLMLEVEGRERGDLWLLSEYVPTIEKYRKRYARRQRIGHTVKV